MAAPHYSLKTQRREKLAAARRKPPPGCDPDSIVLSFWVPKEYAGCRLDRFVQRCIPRLSRTRAQHIVRSCARHADGRKRRPSDKVREGEVVLLVRQRFEEPADVPLRYEILYEDAAILAIDKPAGLPMHPSATYHKNTLSWLLKQRYGEDGPRIVHRIDRETSGVVLCARTREAERALKGDFERHRVEKGYLAIVRGRVAKARQSVDVPMGPVREGLHVLMETREGEDGSEAVSEIRVLEHAPGHTLVEASPRSGRQHQLRVHLRHLGHPIVGDKLYGPEREAPFLEYIDTGMTPALCERLGHHRQALHAHRLQFRHPGSGEPMTVEAPLPQDLASLWHVLQGAPETRCDEPTSISPAAEDVPPHSGSPCRR